MVKCFCCYVFTNVLETRINTQVPKTVMVPEQYTVMVPQVRTRMVPKTTTETRTVTVNRPVETTQTMVRMVNKVVEGQKIVSSNQFLDYERPKMIQGKFLGARQGGIQEVGVQWTGQYYSGGERVRSMHSCTHTYDVHTQLSRNANSSK
jgi:hypothetical protein